ncbi:hypothetical protein KP509_03G008400 [Ceratopteris richardii]|uniref:Uncharacterized protein n=1 Tax=Ceratopteris richardii TaxID=49495 RepID=A0A8T2UZY8_CERRI|nr:hypothetical protein KP509_03G008400 [Ceratopteris richardii]
MESIWRVVMSMSMSCNRSTTLISTLTFGPNSRLPGRLRAQFVALVELLPSVFVGTSERVREIVSVMAGASKRSFSAKGMHVPPWRRLDCMSSKWRLPSWAGICDISLVDDRTCNNVASQNRNHGVRELMDASE